MFSIKYQSNSVVAVTKWSLLVEFYLLQRKVTNPDKLWMNSACCFFHMGKSEKWSCYFLRSCGERSTGMMGFSSRYLKSCGILSWWETDMVQRTKYNQMLEMVSYLDTPCVMITQHLILDLYSSWCPIKSVISRDVTLESMTRRSVCRCVIGALGILEGM